MSKRAGVSVLMRYVINCSENENDNEKLII